MKTRHIAWIAIIAVIMVAIAFSIVIKDDLRTKTTDNGTEDRNTTVTMSYKPMQCEEEPWNAWLKDSSIRFIKAPTESEVITLYYAQAHNIEVTGYKRINLGQMTCDACDVCIKGYIIQLTVPSSAIDTMQREGWTK